MNTGLFMDEYGEKEIPSIKQGVLMDGIGSNEKVVVVSYSTGSL